MTSHGTSPEDLARAARLAEENPFYLARLLRAYQVMERLDEQALAHYLGCLPAVLPQIALCQRPAADNRIFRRDIQAIAERFKLHADHLAHVVRTADAADAFAQLPETSETGYLIAARDRLEPDDEEGVSENKSDAP